MNNAGPLVEFARVTVRYPAMERAAIADLTLRVEPGERVALVGPSGAGKSTILALAAGLALPSTGHVRVLGVDTVTIGSRANRRTRSRIGVIGQDYALVGPLRAASNVAAGRLGQWSWPRALASMIRPQPIDEIRGALGQVGIGEKVWERTDRLSGGEQQRTAIARALFQDPDLMLADEPVSALDPARSESVMSLLASEYATGERALLVSMHDAPLALAHCDRIIGVREGRVRFDLPARDVDDELLADLYGFERPSTA